MQDTWRANSRWSFDLGLRYDMNRGRDGSNHLVADGTLVSPRLGASWDPTGARHDDRLGDLRALRLGHCEFDRQ